MEATVIDLESKMWLHLFAVEIAVLFGIKMTKGNQLLRNPCKINYWISNIDRDHTQYLKLLWILNIYIFILNSIYYILTPFDGSFLLPKPSLSIE